MPRGAALMGAASLLAALEALQIGPADAGLDTPALRRVRHVWGRDPERPGRRDALSDHAALIADIDFGPRFG